MRRSGSRLSVAVGLVATAALLAACSGGGSSPSPAPSPRPSSPAEVTILSPRNGEVVKSSTIHVDVRLTGAEIVPATTTHITPTQGHLHVYLDDQIVSMNFGLQQTIAGVSAGQHFLKVEFVASDHQPFDPRVFTGVVFVVKP